MTKGRQSKEHNLMKGNDHIELMGILTGALGLLQHFSFQEKLHPARSPTGHSLLIFTSIYINILLHGKLP